MIDASALRRWTEALSGRRPASAAPGMPAAGAGMRGMQVDIVLRSDLTNPATLDSWLEATGVDANASLVSNSCRDPFVANSRFLRENLDAESYLSLSKRQNAVWATRIVVKGIEHSQNKNWIEAIKEYTKAIEIHPECVDAFVARGAAYANQGKFDKAIQDHSHALKLQPNHENARRYLEKCMQRRDEIEAEKRSAVDGAFLMPMEAGSSRRISKLLLHPITTPASHNPAPPAHAPRTTSSTSLNSAAPSADAFDFVFAQGAVDTVAPPPLSSKKKKRDKSSSEAKKSKKRKHEKKSKKKKRSKDSSPSRRRQRRGEDSDSGGKSDEDAGSDGKGRPRASGRDRKGSVSEESDSVSE
ncbi:hypothetical protein BC830DRAFT_1217527 [Chytriomyces sp. MP71]|nr:hypothetical protein BC830DRAFT_1217527 [Chytriomyces sp. MP71]